MDIRVLTSAEDLRRYDDWVRDHPLGTLWQSSEWKIFQESLGRKVRLYGAFDKQNIVASALVTIDRTSFGLSSWDIPRGPLLSEGWEGRSDQRMFLDAVIRDARKDGCFSLFLSPATPLPSGVWPLRTSDRHEQPEATRIIDLVQQEEAILAQMKPKGRYNIGVAQRYDIDVLPSRDIDAFYGLLTKTAGRDAFHIRPKSHYKAFLEFLPQSFLFLAYHTSWSEETPVAGLLGTMWERTGIYYYGASSYEHRSLMAPYLAQWEAMRYCRNQGCARYDLFGVAPPDAADNHPWQGISSFKEKFGGEITLYPHEQEIILRPMARGLLKIKRKIVG